MLFLTSVAILYARLITAGIFINKNHYTAFLLKIRAITLRYPLCNHFFIVSIPFTANIISVMTKGRTKDFRNGTRFTFQPINSVALRSMYLVIVPPITPNHSAVCSRRASSHGWLVML